MAHNLDMTNGRANFAFTGDRKNIWHRLGTEMAEGMSIDEWAKAAGLDWQAIPTPAFHQLPDGTMQAVPGFVYNTRNDNFAPLGYVSKEGYKRHQASDLLNVTNRYISVDPRFAMSAAGSLDGGKKIWCTAKFNGDIEVAGSPHSAYLLATTSFNGAMATWFVATMTRGVCDNTVSAALASKEAFVRVNHNVKFDAVKAGKELAAIAQGFAKFKAIGDAMALVDFSASETVALFKKLLDIDPNAKQDEISTRKLNQFTALTEAYAATEREGTESGKVWTALNAVTRYVDHARSSRNGDSAESARFDSALFGSGARMKEQAFGLLLPLIRDKVAA